MGRAHFDNADFLAVARARASDCGPAAVTIDSVIPRLKAPKGSFHYRFASRDALLGALWLSTVLAYQEGFVAAIEAGDGLAAALHTPASARLNLDDARLLLLYSRHDFVQGDWPAALKRGVRDQARRFEECPCRFARHAFGRVGPAQLRRATFVLAEAPVAAVKSTSSVASRRPRWSMNGSPRRIARLLAAAMPAVTPTMAFQGADRPKVTEFERPRRGITASHAPLLTMAVLRSQNFAENSSVHALSCSLSTHKAMVLRSAPHSSMVSVKQLTVEYVVGPWRIRTYLDRATFRRCSHTCERTFRRP